METIPICKAIYQEIARQRGHAFASLCKSMALHAQETRVHQLVQRWLRIAELITVPGLGILDYFPAPLRTETTTFLDQVDSAYNEMKKLVKRASPITQEFQRLRVLTQASYELAAQIREDLEKSGVDPLEGQCWYELERTVSQLLTYLDKGLPRNDAVSELVVAYIPVVIAEMTMNLERERNDETLCLETTPAPQGLPGKAAAAA